MRIFIYFEKPTGISLSGVVTRDLVLSQAWRQAAKFREMINGFLKEGEVPSDESSSVKKQFFNPSNFNNFQSVSSTPFLKGYSKRYCTIIPEIPGGFQ